MRKKLRDCWKVNMNEYFLNRYMGDSYKWLVVQKRGEINKIYKQIIADKTSKLSDLAESYLYSISGTTSYEYKHITLDETNIDTFKVILPYISFIQERFGELTKKLPKGFYYGGVNRICVNINLNSTDNTSIIDKLPDEVFLLVRAFKYIQSYKKVPKYLIKYIEEVLASELLEG